MNQIPKHIHSKEGAPPCFRALEEAEPAAFKDADLDRLAREAMHTPTSGNSNIPFGFTYFGQFVAHDMSNISHLADGEFQPSPALNLDGVYGKDYLDPSVAINRLNGQMLLGEIEGTNRQEDLPRDGAGLARIPDHRNDENLVVGQIHSLFLRLHNFLWQPQGKPIKSFERAKALSIATYHDLLLHDYLPRITDPALHELIFDKRCYLISPHQIRANGVPIEVSLAAFRFGHSMVRSAYDINPSKPRILLQKLFAMTGAMSLGGHRQLPADWQVDWSFLFERKTLGKAGRIRPQLSPELGNVPLHDGSLAFLNLKRGNLYHLPSGQSAVKTAISKIQATNSALAEKFKVLGCTHEDFKAARYIAGEAKAAELEILQSSHMIENTPLWYYLLAEDWLAHPNSTNRGNHLGMLGSLLVIETVKALVTIAAENSGISPESVAQARQAFGLDQYSPIHMQHVITQLN